MAARSPGERMKDDRPTLKLDKLFIWVSIMTDWPVNTHNIHNRQHRPWDWGDISQEMQNRNYER